MYRVSVYIQSRFDIAAQEGLRNSSSSVGYYSDLAQLEATLFYLFERQLLRLPEVGFNSGMRLDFRNNA